MGLFGNLIPTILGGVASIIPGVGPYLAQREENIANKKLQESANAANLALWREQSAYNSPIEQMKRLETAGLNPNLAYGQIADSKASAPPTMEAPRYEAYKNNFSLADYQQVRNMQEQNKLTRNQIESAAQETRIKKAEADYKEYENSILKRSNSLRTDSPFIKSADRVSDYVRTRVVEPVGGLISKMPQFKFASWLAEKAGKTFGGTIGTRQLQSDYVSKSNRFIGK